MFILDTGFASLERPRSLLSGFLGFPLTILQSQDGQPLQETLLDLVETVVIVIELLSSCCYEIARKRQSGRFGPRQGK